MAFREFGGKETFEQTDVVEKDEEFHASVRDRENILQSIRADIIGAKKTFHSGPYGEKPIIYADWTASGRAIKGIESFVLENVLPFYGIHFYLLPRCALSAFIMQAIPIPQRL